MSSEGNTSNSQAQQQQPESETAPQQQQQKQAPQAPAKPKSPFAGPLASLAASGGKVTDKNPVMLLNELRQGLDYVVTESGDNPANKRFIVTVKADGDR